MLYEHLLRELNGPAGLAVELVGQLKAGKVGSSATLKLLRSFLVLMIKADESGRGRPVETMTNEELEAELQDLLEKTCPGLGDEPPCQNAPPTPDASGPTFPESGPDFGRSCAPLVCP
ncbi:MAG: hypothetical protein ACYC35_20310 [Pirellulales bacterium]